MKERLDVLLVKQQLAQSREKAKAIIMSGIVYVDGQKEDKAGATFEEDKVKIEVRGNTLPFVSRGGLKLAKAFEVFPIDVNGMVCLDIGASTGGFTDCWVQKGAKLVYAVDVGYGQLAGKLVNDEHVINMEKTNLSDQSLTELDPKPEMISLDLSYLSLKKALPICKEILKEQGLMICLIKPLTRIIILMD